MSDIVPPADLQNCDREPIHIPGSIQPHGVLLALDPADLTILQVSANATTVFGEEADNLLGRSLIDLLAPQVRDAVSKQLRSSEIERNPTPLCSCNINGTAQELIAHTHEGATIVEIESADKADGLVGRDLYLAVRGFVAKLRGVSSVETMTQLAAEEARRITGFDRVMVYRFDESWNGVVVAESRDPEIESYLGLHFPASDIPAQARQLYALNAFRLIADVNERSVALSPPSNPLTQRPLDLSFAHLRSVSPVHLEYLRNMGVTASMSISIFRGERLWGLIACHHRRPAHLPYEVRTACEFLGQVLSVQLEEKLHNIEISHRVMLRSIQAILLASMTSEDSLAKGLLRHEPELLKFAGAAGAAVVIDDQVNMIGATPSEQQIREIIAYLSSRVDDDVFHSDSFPSFFTPARNYSELASGVLAIAISRRHGSYVIWFRPEVVYTVTWSGDPNKPVDRQSGRLSPRRSFEAWKQTVYLRSARFRPAELEAAGLLRSSIVDIVVRNNEELAAVNAELRESNKELEAFSYSVSHDLRAPFRHISSYSELLMEEAGASLSPTHRRWIQTIVDSAQYAGKLVDNLLSFSQMGRAALHLRPVNVNVLVSEVIDELNRENPDRVVSWRIDRLPNVVADPTMLRLVWQNLLSNAMKYTRRRDAAVISITSYTAPEDQQVVFKVEDNGIGFDMRYINKLFGVFQRLHRVQDFEGTGIGLANIRRIISKHGGQTWAEGEVDRGATFYFSLPPAEVAEFTAVRG